MSNEPAAKLRDGLLNATVWANQTSEGKTFYSTTLTRSYKQGEEWKQSDSLNTDDLLPAARLLQRAYDEILELKQGD